MQIGKELEHQQKYWQLCGYILCIIERTDYIFLQIHSTTSFVTYDCRKKCFHINTSAAYKNVEANSINLNVIEVNNEFTSIQFSFSWISALFNCHFVHNLFKYIEYNIVKSFKIAGGPFPTKHVMCVCI